MFKKTTFIAIFLFAVFVSSDSIFPIDASAYEGYRLQQEVWLSYAGPQKQRVNLGGSANKKSTQATGNEELEELEEELQELIEEMKKLEKEAREKVLKEILPRIKEEMEKLREKLRKWRDEEDQSGPIGVEATEI
jgi:peptidoglycan hydrolase CwlO-like protein